MAYRIITPEFSFVRFSDQHLDDANWMDEQIPGAELGIILPVNRAQDYAFQFIVETDTEAEADNICASTGGPAGTPSIVMYPGGALPETITLAEWNAIVSSYISEDVISEMGGGRIRISDTQVFFYIPRMGFLEDLECGECFQMIFAPNNIFDYGFFVSNIFNYQCDNTDFTSVIDYYSEKDEADFLYCVSASVKNRARLPIYLTRPTYPEEEESYRMSNGRYKVRKAQVRKLYEVVTDNFPVWIIECLRAVFIHDSIVIEDDLALAQTMPYKGGIVKEGAFEPQYTEYLNYPLARVAFKVIAIEYGLTKNNCGECPEYDLSMSTSDISLGVLIAGHGYTEDLVPHADAGCCSPVTFGLVSWNSAYLAAAPTISQTPGLFASISFVTKVTMTPAVGVILATVSASCSTATGTIQITGTVT